MQTFRDTFFGAIVYHASGKKVFQFEEEKPDFVVPERFQKGYKERAAQQEKKPQQQDGSFPFSAKPRASPLTTPGGDQFYDAHHDERSLREAEGVTPGGARTPGRADTNGSGDSSQRTLARGESNDDLERNERTISASLTDAEQKYSRVLEEKILLEQDMLDKIQIEEALQREKDRHRGRIS